MFLHKGKIALLIVALSLAVAVPVFAYAPSMGTVYEGVTVPGVALGDTRAQVEAAWGEPESCQDLVLPAVSELGSRRRGLHRHPLEGEGRSAVEILHQDHPTHPALAEILHVTVATGDQLRQRLCRHRETAPGTHVEARRARRMPSPTEVYDISTITAGAPRRRGPAGCRPGR